MRECCFSLVISSLVCSISAVRPFAHTEYGGVYGTEGYSYKGRKFNVFMSIPYAEKPIGRLRFEEPKEPKSWSTPIDGSVTTPACIQNPRPNIVTGQEDCLYINVFTPNLDLRNVSNPLPVIVFVHGGAFYFFSSLTFGPRYLLDKDIVLVTFNYRLGIFGFLCTEDEVVPGNLGLKDQSAALGWVQRNIRGFGGDPDSVTLLGMSAGSVSVHFHYFSLLSRGLFHRGYMIGGTAFNVWAMQKKPLEKTRRAAEWAGCPSNVSTSAIVQCLRTRPAPLLARTVALFKNFYGPIAPWAPVVDRWSRNPFISEYPMESLLRRRHYSVPLIVSDAICAGLFPAAVYMGDLDLAILDLEWSENAPYALDTIDSVEKSDSNSVTARVRKHYFGRKAIYQNITNLVKLMSDRMYFADMSKGLSLQAALNPRLYFYMFNYKGSLSLSDEFIGKNNFGAGHVDDFFYLMNKTYPQSTERSKSDVRMIERLTEMVYHYAKTGEAVFLPGRRWLPQRGPSPAFTYMQIDSPDTVSTVRVENFGDGAFWDSLPLQEPWAGRSTPSLL